MGSKFWLCWTIPRGFHFCSTQRTELEATFTSNGLPWWLIGKESTCQCRRCRFDPWFGKIPWRRKWQLTPVFLPGKSHGQMSLAGYSPCSRKRVGHDLATKLSLLVLSHGMRSSDSSVGGPSINFFSWLWQSFIECSVDYCFSILRILK